ncbi:enkurin isoform 1-T1 [Synchiropus picturatus]
MFAQESVYNALVEEDDGVLESSLGYMSKFRPQVVQEHKQRKSPMKTMGPLKVDAPSPDKFLKKHSKEPKLPGNTLVEGQRIHILRKPPVPGRKEKPIMGIQSGTNFIKSNTVVVPRTMYRAIQARSYKKKKDYGEMPLYLVKRKLECERAQEEYEEELRRQEAEASKHLSKEEKENILEGLKKNWSILHHEYQRLPFIICTMVRQKRKEELENQLDQLEKDISLLERFTTIYITD